MEHWDNDKLKSFKSIQRRVSETSKLLYLWVYFDERTMMAGCEISL